MSNDNQPRRCSGCNETGHNIRSCIKFLDENIILEYSRRILTNIPNEFPHHLIPPTNKLNKLCQKYGLDFHISDHLKLERLHTIYLYLGIQHRRSIMNTNNVRYRNIQRPIIYRPSYLPPIIEQDIIVSENTNTAMFNILNQIQLQILTFQTQPDRVVIPIQTKPSLQIILDKSKFFEGNDIGECPICYDNCKNTIVTDCNHTYCQPCISKLINTINKNALSCPLCRENIKKLFVFSEESSHSMLCI